MEKTRVDEQEISLKRMLEQCLRNFGKVSIVGVVCAVMFVVLIFIKDVGEYNVAVNNQNNGEYELTEAEEIAINNYNFLKSRVEYLKEYEKESILMSLESSNVFCGNLVYQVIADESIKYDVARLLVHYINAGMLSDEISKAEKIGEPQYLREIIYASIYEGSLGNGSGVVDIQILAPTKELYEIYSNLTKQCIASYCNTLPSIRADEIILAEEHCIIRSLSGVYDNQKAHFERRSTTEAELANLLSTFSPKLKLYIEKMESDEVNTDAQVVEIEKPSIRILYAVVGFIIGCTIAVLVICVQVMFGGKLQSDKELSRRLRIANIGTFVKNNKGPLNKFISKCIYGKTREAIESQVDLIVNKLNAIIGKNSVEEVVLVGTFDDAEKEIQVLVELFKAKSLNCLLVGNKRNAIEVISQMNEKQNIVLVEKIGVSKIKDIYEVADLCNDLDKNIAGYISIRE